TLRFSCCLASGTIGSRSQVNRFRRHRTPSFSALLVLVADDRAPCAFLVVLLLAPSVRGDKSIAPIGIGRLLSALVLCLSPIIGRHALFLLSSFWHHRLEVTSQSLPKA